MKKTLALIHLLLAGFAVSAQESTCVTPTHRPSSETEKSASCAKTSTTYNTKYKLKETFKPNAANSVVKTVHVNFVVIQRANGSGNFYNDPTQIGRIQDMFQTANDIFENNNTPTYTVTSPGYIADTKIRIELDNIFFVRDTTVDSMYYYGHNYGTGYHYASFSELNSYVLAKVPASQYAMNYYFTGGEFSGAAGMAGTFAVHSFYRHSPEMNVTPAYDWSYAFHFAHEIAHNLDLLHTYDSNQETCNSSQLDFVSDIFNTTSSCLPSCDVCLLASTTSNNNIMGGQSASWCYTSLLQCGIAHRAMMTFNHYILGSGSPRLIKDFTSGYSTTPMDITASETWDFPVKMYQDLVVKSGATLTIQCEVQFVPQASLIIEPGGRVIIDGGKLTNEWHDHTYWQGVQVWGTSNQHQYPIGSPTYQGYLQLINGGSIENAVNGARNWKPGDYNKIGGVIVASNAAFKNNRRAIEFVTYRNFSQTNPLITRPNLSSFSQTNFEVNNSIIGGSSNFIYHVSMWEVTGINFTDCDFSNLCSSKTHSTSGNRGIYSIDANYNVKAGCSSGLSPCPDANLLKSTFTGFSAGIEASDGSTTNTISVDQSVFTDNLYGVLVTGVNNTSVNRSNFYIGGFTGTGLIPGSTHYGIYTDNSTGFVIEENKLYRTDGTTSAVTGVCVDDAGAVNNRTYRNEYYNNYIGNEARGLNRLSTDNTVGYQVLCSKFDHFGYSGFNINGLGVSGNGVRYYQGNSATSTATGNTFTNLVSGSVGVRNLSTSPITYLYAGTNSLPTTSGSVTLLNVANQNTCPSSFDTGGGMSGRAGQSGGLTISSSTFKNYETEVTALQKEMLELKYTYASLIDEGNTQTFIGQINENWSKDAWTLRDEIINHSPNVSREALLAAIGKNILPNAMVLEICLANPESIKGEDFIEQLKEVTANTVPEYICGIIRNNWYEESGRANLEKAIAKTDYEIQTRMNFMLTSVLNDEQSSDEDKLRELSKQDNPQIVFERITYYVDHNDFTKANETLSTLPFKNETELQLFEGMADYIQLKQAIHAEGRLISQLNENEISQLVALSNGKGKTALIAKNILCFFYEICSERDGHATGEGIETDANAAQQDANKVYYSITAFPNPATDYVTIKWNIYEKLNDCKIFVYSLDGKLMTTKTIDRPEGELMIDTKAYKGGTYQYVIENNQVTKTGDKFVVVNK